MRTTVESYKARAGRLDLEGIDFNDFRDRPLSRNALRSLQYMADIEHHTVCYLRELLMTPAHRDPDVTDFLSCWVFEELWHGEAIEAVLDAHRAGSDAAPASFSPPAAQLSRLGRRAASLRSATKFGLTTVFGRAFIPIHMSWGAINEWTTQAGYARLGVIEKHPTLSELLRRIMKQEGRHIDFYASEAARRLHSSETAQRLTRRTLKHFWAPVGSGVKPKSEVSFLCRYLFDGDDGLEVAKRIDRRVDGLPGLSGLHLLEGVIGRPAASGLA